MDSFKVGDRVSREVNIYDKSKGVKIGIVIKRYSKPIKKYNENLIMGPYPELYKVLWDSGKIEKGFLPHGISKIKEEK